MKLSYIAAFAAAACAFSSFQAKACNPMLGKDFGKHVAPTVIPAARLARNNPHAPGQSSIIGLWHDVRTASDGSMFMEGYDTWSRDGTEYELANLPPASGNVCVGIWVKQGKTIGLTAHVAWLYDLNNNYVGTLNITQQTKVSKDGNNYSGPFDAKFYDPSGVLFQEITGTANSERMAQ